MALVIRTTAGSSDANSFASVADFIAYCAKRSHVPAVVQAFIDAASLESPDASAVDAIGRGLLTATRVIVERVEWRGVRTSLSQALPWPRDGVENREGDDWIDKDIVPDFVVEGTCELAVFLIDSDRLTEPASRNIAELDVAGAVSIKFDKQDVTPIIPDVVWATFYPFACNAPVPTASGGRQMRQVDLLRT